MSTPYVTRRGFLKAVSAGASAAAIGARSVKGEAEPPAATGKDAALTVNPQPRFPLSPYLHMQFMEPLGTTDGSVAAAWDFEHDCWRPDVVAVTKELAPSLMRWEGCFVSSLMKRVCESAFYGVFSVGVIRAMYNIRHYR